MSLQNVSLLLERNQECFKEDSLLVVNPPADSWLVNVTNNAHQTIVWTTNFANYGLFTKLKTVNTDIFFSHTLADYDQDTLAAVKRVILHFPKSKQEFVYLCDNLLSFLPTGTEVFIVGENKGGIKSCAKQLGTEFSDFTKVDSAKHCALFLCTISENKPFNLDDWFQEFSINIGEKSLSVYSLPGVFNHGKLDAGTALLLDTLPELKGRVLDFGCGAGVIAATIAQQEKVTEVHACDVSAMAIAASKKTFEANQLDVNVFATDGMSEVKGQFHHIVSNPPFHTGLKTDYRVPEQFIANSAKHLKIKGMLSIVANNFLPYPEIINKYVGPSNTLINHKGFSVHQATLKLGLSKN